MQRKKVFLKVSRDNLENRCPLKQLILLLLLILPIRSTHSCSIASSRITTITKIETTIAATAAMAEMMIATEIITAGTAIITDSMVGTKWIIGIQQHEATQDSLNGKRTGGEASLIGRYR